MARNRTMLGETLQFLWKRKAWWLIPTIVVLILVSALIIASQSSTLSAFVYALF